MDMSEYWYVEYSAVYGFTVTKGLFDHERSDRAIAVEKTRAGAMSRALAEAVATTQLADSVAAASRKQLEALLHFMTLVEENE